MHEGHLSHPPCPKGLGLLMLRIPDPRHPSLSTHVPSCPLVPAHQVDKTLSGLLTPFLNCICACSFSLSLCAFLIDGKHGDNMAYYGILDSQYRPPRSRTPPYSTRPHPTLTPVVHQQMSGVPCLGRARPCPCRRVVASGESSGAGVVATQVSFKAFASIFRILVLPSLLLANPRHVPSWVAFPPRAAGSSMSLHWLLFLCL